jgi:filamentous hemagglutinin
VVVIKKPRPYPAGNPPENTIKNGKSTPSRGGTTVHFDPESKVSVVTNESGRVVTVKYGDK